MKRLLNRVLHEAMACLLPESKHEDNHFQHIYYHAIQDKALHPLLANSPVSVKQFEKHLDYLIDHYDIVPLNSFVLTLKESNMMTRQKKMLSISFDDGWKDNYTTLFPIIKSRKIPITIFLNTYNVSHQKPFWHVELLFLLEEIRKNNTHIIMDEEQVLSLDSLEQAYKQAFEIILPLAFSKRECFLIQLRKMVKKVNIPKHWLTWEECQEMENSGLVRFAAHTHTHTSIAALDESECEKELLDNITELKKHLKHPLSFFAYPNGLFNKKKSHVLKECKIKAAFTTEAHSTKITNDLLFLPRHGICNWCRVAHLKNKLSGNQQIIDTFKN
ncbi:MAG: polysaccharide deacetylase family protein [bacterium]